MTKSLFFGLFAFLLFAGCEDTMTLDESTAARRETVHTYQRAQVERALAATAIPYLVFDFGRGKMEIKQSGAIVWDEPIILAEEADTLRIQELLQETAQEPLLRYIQERQLFEHHKRYADSVLTIICGILNVGPELLQRELPVRFDLKTSDGLLFRFEASDDTLLTKPKNRLLSVLDGLLGVGKDEPIAIIQMPMERALTLYYVARPGASVLINPSLRN
ncbi:hypothetical protein KKC97_09270 [bacterium]|nr:hypothetical protein [bacterium]